MELTEDRTEQPRLPPARVWTHRLFRAPGPQRAISLATFVNTFGSGMFMTSGVLYFTQMVGLPTARYALGLFVGSMVGLVAGLLIGQLADKVGSRETQIAVMISGAIGMACYLLVGNFWQFVLVSSLMGLVSAAATSSLAPMIRGYAGADPAEFRAYLRSVTNLAMALGSLAAGGAIELGTRSAYQSMLGGRAVSYAGCALLLLRVPRLAPVPTPPMSGRWQALRDRPYLTATVLNCLMSVHFSIPTVLLPLWIVEDTHAPRWMVSGVFLLNTGIVVGLQVRVSKGVVNPAAAGRAMLRAGAAIAVGLALISVAATGSALVATALLVVGVSVYTLGELWHAAASMEYTYGLAAAHAQGQYSGVFGLGTGVSYAIAPSVVGVFALHFGRFGLVLLGLLFLAVGAVSRPLVAFTLRTAQRPYHESRMGRV